MSSVDVIIPCYKYANFLKGCVESVLAQTGVSLRVLILDDASPDHTPQVCAELSLADSRVEFYRHKNNKGHIATYNEGLEWAQADYTLLMSADDLLTSGSLERAATLLDAHPEVGFIYGREILFTSDMPLPEVPALSEGKDWEIMTGRQFMLLACSQARAFVPAPTVVVRTTVQKSLGGYLRELPHTADLEMWLRFSVHGSVGYLNAYQAYYRKHAKSMTFEFPGVKDLQQFKAAFDILFMKYGSQIPDHAEFWDLAYANLARRACFAADDCCEPGKWAYSKELSDFALATCPKLEFEAEWLRLRVKQRAR
jgi:glycosyltransferase involved in cell wall biosynthesis